ncbi:MAG: S-layer homology domain-containing protein [Candidatus Gracilibacteria bacterium]
MKPLSVEPQSPEPVPANMEITRAELAKLIVEATGVPMNTAGGPHYPDVTSDQWYYQYVETAHNMGWMVGYPDGMFKPAGKVNRAEGAKIFTLSVIANCNNGPAYSEPYYKDVSPADWFSGPVHKMADCKMVDILPSDTSMYFPSYLLSRGRAQYMVNNAKQAGWIK